MKSFIVAAAAAAPFLAAPAFAGPYVNIETESGFAGSDYAGTVTEFVAGYEGTAGENAGWYVEVGPAIVSPDGQESETELFAEAGVAVDLTENIEIYGEVSLLTDDNDNLYGTKAGVTYRF